MPDSLETIIYSVDSRICTITLNRPEKRNAFSPQVVNELKQAFIRAANDDEIKVIILAAEGQVFSAGADLAYLQSVQKNSYEENLSDSSDLAGLFKLVYTLSKPVIARVEGHAIAGGCGLAAVCDFSYAVPAAQFGYTEVRIGFIPAIVMVFLLRKISEKNVKELLLTGKLINATRAMQMGLINGVVPAEDIRKTVNDLALELCNEASRNSLKITKQMIANVQEMNLDEALLYAAEMNAKTRASEDCIHGIQSFLDKKKPDWK